MKKVSICIPTWNQDKYIEQAIESALRQDYANCQIIVCDDDSSDATSSIVEKYSTTKNFKYVKNIDRLGRVGNYRKLLYELAEGDFVLMLDGDDYLCRDTYISEAMQMAEQHNLQIVFANKIAYFEKDGSFVKDTCNNKLPSILDGNWLFMNYWRGYKIAHMSSLYSRKEAMRVGYYQKDIISSDWESVLKLILNKKVGYINQYIGVWRKHSQNQGRSFSPAALMQNAEYIESPYAYAMSLDNADVDELMVWRRNMLMKYFESLIVDLALRGMKNELSQLQIEIEKYDIQIKKLIDRDFKMIAFNVIRQNKWLAYYSMKLLGHESYARDCLL